jgi:hypothetical protein
MRVGFCLLLATCIAAGAAAGPISKFDDTAPKLEYETSRSIWDVERCLIDADAAPFIYRQPDRPNEETMIWTSPSGTAGIRIDLRASPGGTHVRSWRSLGYVKRCAPPDEPH